MTLLVISEILGLFVNTLNAEVWDFLRYSENLQQSIQMQLSNKSKIFSEIFTPFLKFTSNFKHFKKKMTLIAYLFLELRTAKHVVTKMSKNHLFRISFDSQHSKGFETLLKSA